MCTDDYKSLVHVSLLNKTGLYTIYITIIIIIFKSFLWTKYKI
jgi:hypothetical protein